MAKTLDFSSLTRAERVVFVSAVALVVNGFIPWWYRVATTEGTYTYNAGLTGYGVFAVAAAAVVIAAVLGRTNIWPHSAPRGDGIAYAALGATASAALVAQMTSARGEWIGLYVGLALAVTLAVGGLLRTRQRRAGWQ